MWPWKLLDVGSQEQLQVQSFDRWLPIHIAAGFSSSPEVVQKLLEQGGLEQLQAKNSQSVSRYCTCSKNG